jgi:hypothetical protein
VKYELLLYISQDGILNEIWPVDVSEASSHFVCTADAVLLLQFELNALTGEPHHNGSFTVGDATERHLSAPFGSAGDDANNHTKFTSAASEYFK